MAQHTYHARAGECVPAETETLRLLNVAPLIFQCIVVGHDAGILSGYCGVGYRAVTHDWIWRGRRLWEKRAWEGYGRRSLRVTGGNSRVCAALSVEPYAGDRYGGRACCCNVPKAKAGGLGSVWKGRQAPAQPMRPDWRFEGLTLNGASEWWSKLLPCQLQNREFSALAFLFSSSDRTSANIHYLTAASSFHDELVFALA